MVNYKISLHKTQTKKVILPEIEREAYEKGNMTFRNWTDTLTEGVLKEGRYDKISNTISSKIFNQWREDINNGALASRFEESFDI
jgi:hypothetical protein